MVVVKACVCSVRHPHSQRSQQLGRKSRLESTGMRSISGVLMVKVHAFGLDRSLKSAVATQACIPKAQGDLHPVHEELLPVTLTVAVAVSCTFRYSLS